MVSSPRLLLEFAVIVFALLATLAIGLRLRESSAHGKIGARLLQSLVAFLVFPPIAWLFASLSWQVVYRFAYAPYQTFALILFVPPILLVTSVLVRVFRLGIDRDRVVLALLLWASVLVVWALPILR